ncbi:hypothetical protein H4Q26_016379 [Puccinia striiformis f. sp. tritici PST-130]|nr:hypothetical protein H4Q26_016379 [Puccinia striiformis f. sp. tritici PST-130]
MSMPLHSLGPRPIAGTLNTAGATVQGVQRTADAQVSASVYQGFVTFATALRRVLSTISSLPSLYARAEARASIHASLLQIQAAVTLSSGSFCLHLT